VVEPPLIGARGLDRCAPRAVRARRDRGLHDCVPPRCVAQQPGEIDPRAALQPACRHDGRAACRQVAQIALVAVPSEQRRWIPQRHPRVLEPGHPRKELLQSLVVVPAGADEYGLKLVPAHVGGVPHGGYGREPELGESRDQQAVVVVQRRELGTRREGDAFHRLKKAIFLDARTHQFSEDALMHRFGTLIAALTLGALAALPLPAQSPTDLAAVCKVLGDARLGQWASFDGTSCGSGGGKLRLAVVGSDRSGDSTMYWFGVSVAGRTPGKSGVVQILTTSLASGLEAPRALVIKAGPQPAMRISGEMAGMMGKQGGQNASAFDWAAKCTGAHVVGWESVTVPAGTFRALHVTTQDGG